MRSDSSREKINIKFILCLFAVWRFLLFVPLYIGYQLVPLRLGFLFSNTELYSWANFDGVHYLDIATNGYTTNGRFFPLFPMLIHFLSPFFLGNFFWTGFIVANLLFLLALILLYKLIRLDFDESITRWAIFFLLIFPTSFYFGSVYSESLFLLLAVAVFYFTRTNKWFLAGCCGLLLTATRLVGIFILPALVYELYIQRFDIKHNLQKLGALFIIPFGLVGFAVYSFFRWGDFLNFIYTQGQLENGRSVSSIILFPQTIYRYLKILFDISLYQYEWWVALFELVMFFFISYLLVMAYKKDIKKSYIIFSVLMFLLPVLSGTFTGLPRYVTILFPIYIVLALIRNRFIKITYIFISLAFLFILTMLFSRGYFVA